MPPQLRPLSIGDLLDSAFRLYRQHFLFFCKLVALLLVPLTIIGFFAQAVPLIQGILNLVQSFVITNVLTAALVSSAAQLYLRQTPRTKTAYQAGWQACAKVFAAQLLQGLVLLVPLAVFACVAVMTLSVLRGSPFIIVAGIVLIVPIFILLTTRWYVAIPLIVLEGLGPIDSLRRSWELTKGRMWPVFATALALGIIVFVLTGMPTLFVVYGTSLLGIPGLDSLANQQVAYVLTQLGQILTLPITAVVKALVYYDLRVRAEAYDLEVMATASNPSFT